jgi:hypothetical protein
MVEFLENTAKFSKNLQFIPVIIILSKVDKVKEGYVGEQ